LIKKNKAPAAREAPPPLQARDRARGSIRRRPPSPVDQ